MKSTLYHGGSHAIERPEIREPERTLDYQIMIKPITADNLYLILPGKVTQMALLYAKKFNVKIIDAIKIIYKSNTYKDLEREETKLWHLGPVALMEYMAEHN